MNDEKYDVIIIGGGPAGLSAAVYTSRADFKTLVLDEPDKLLKKVKKIENYFGFPEGISGEEILERGKKQAEDFGTVVKEEKALLIKTEGVSYRVDTVDNSYLTGSLILSPGIQRKKPSLDGIEDYEGKGVSYCVTCDAPLFKNKKVGLLGSEDLVAKEALELYEFTQDIKIFTNGEDLEIHENLRKQIQERDIPVIKKKVKEIKSNDKFQGLVFEDGEEEMQGLMIAEGTSGSLDFARSLGIMIEDGKLVVDENQFTRLPRVYAAGDCTGGARQISAAVGEGAEAAINLINDLRDEEYKDWKH